MKVHASHKSMRRGKPLRLGKKKRKDKRVNLYEKLKPNLVSNQKHI